MASIRARKESGYLFFDFRVGQVRCREQTMLVDTAANRRRMQKVLDKICREISLGTFRYESYFPNSKLAKQFTIHPTSVAQVGGQRASNAPLLCEFAEIHFAEQSVGWREGTRLWMRSLYDQHLLPDLGNVRLDDLRREDILQFRLRLSQKRSASGRALSPRTINGVMRVTGSLLAEAARRFGINNPTEGVRRLKVQRTQICPFTLDEVQAILETVRPDYRTYLTVRFFTGLRSGEIDGLKWRFVDFQRRQILVRETYTHGRVEYTKTDGSQREVAMSQIIHDALQAHRQGRDIASEYVFCTEAGTPVHAKNFADRVWHPLLRYLGYDRRRPYETRHTCATLWLAAGENPEWIAAQLGHTTTEMLFRVYSRYVPNLTRRDGSAFEQMLAATLARSSSETRDAE